MPPRFTIRQVVGTYRRKAFGTRNDDGTARRPVYPPDAIVAFYGMLELAEEQPDRGRFESERLLRVLLEGPAGLGHRYARQVPFLLRQGDLVRQPDGALTVDGWDVLQEGDTTIADRVARFRARKRNAAAYGPANGPANDTANGAVTVGLTAEPRTGDARAPRRARNAVVTEDGFGDGFGDGDGRAREESPLPTRAAGTWFDGDDPEHAALVWLSQHNATLEPNGRGLHLRLIRLVKTRGLDAVLAAFEELAKDPDVTEANQFVLGADNRLVRIPRAPGPVEEPWERDLRETRERIEAKHEAARQAGQAGQPP